MNIYFSGIGGVGIGPLAEIAHDAGYTVSGSDLQESPVTSELRDKGIPLTIGQDGSFLRAQHEKTPLDWFVYTAALPSDHPELMLARELGIKTAKRDELLAHIIAEKNLKLIAVSGTHGKTTTASMVMWVCKQLNIPVSYSIGASLSWAPSGHYDPKSEIFVYECDEFDRNFLQFHPLVSIITSIDYDHSDTYASMDDYNEAFDQFIHQSQFCVMWHEDVAFPERLKQDAPPIVHSIEKQHPDQVKYMETFELVGKHNRENAFLVLTMFSRVLRVPSELVWEALDTFPGASRRFERLGDHLYTDYGHHPVEIAATLQMARELSQHVVLVYQPHQNVRQHEIQDDYTAEVFQHASEVYWLPTYQTREDPSLAVLTPEALTSQLSNVHIADLDDELWAEVQRHRDAGHLVLFMGAGSIDEWVRSKLD